MTLCQLLFKDGEQKMFNHDIKSAIKTAGLFGYEVAAGLGISETSFSRKIARSELPQEEKARIICAIERLVALRNGGGIVAAEEN